MDRKKWQKVLGITVLAIGVLWMICDGMKGVEKTEDWHGLNSAVELVKNGHLAGYNDKTVGEAVDGFLGNAEWESGRNQSDETMVNVQGSIMYMDWKADCLIQFKVDEEAAVLKIYAFEIDGEGQDQMVIAVLVKEMFK